MGKHTADSPVDTDRLSPWVRSRLEAPNHTAGPHRDPFENRRAIALVPAPDPGVTDSGMFKCSVLPTLPPVPQQPLKGTAKVVLEREYQQLGIDPALIAIIDDAAAELNRREVRATELIVALSYRRRFGVRRLPINRVRIGERVVKLEQRTPWVIRDDSRPYWLGYAPSHEAAMLAIDNMLAEVPA